MEVLGWTFGALGLAGDLFGEQLMRVDVEGRSVESLCQLQLPGDSGGGVVRGRGAPGKDVSRWAAQSRPLARRNVSAKPASEVSAMTRSISF